MEFYLKLEIHEIYGLSQYISFPKGGTHEEINKIDNVRSDFFILS